MFAIHNIVCVRCCRLKSILNIVPTSHSDPVELHREVHGAGRNDEVASHIVMTNT